MMGLITATRCGVGQRNTSKGALVRFFACRSKLRRAISALTQGSAAAMLEPKTLVFPSKLPSGRAPTAEESS